ncbi:hypothetical protein FSST1_009950 [Fusarium sambucinum]
MNTTQIQYPKWLGGSASCMAVAMSHPLDLIKVRMQTATLKNGVWGTIQGIFIAEGVRGFYSGISAGLLRQFTYGSTRFAIYETIKETASQPGIKPTILVLAPAAAISGLCGGFVGNFADIANVRMQNEQSLPTELRKNYRHVFDAISVLAREEGWRGLFKGVGPNCIRGAAMTTSQLSSYDLFKDLLISKVKMADDTVTQGASSVLAALVATTLCNPVDVIKTQVMATSQPGVTMVSISKMMTTKEGLGWIWRGWLPSFVRLGPQTVATLVLLEQHRLVYKRYSERKIVAIA